MSYNVYVSGVVGSENVYVTRNQALNEDKNFNLTHHPTIAETFYWR
jgi:hypothetical protein